VVAGLEEIAVNRWWNGARMDHSTKCRHENHKQEPDQNDDPQPAAAISARRMRPNLLLTQLQSAASAEMSLWRFQSPAARTLSRLNHGLNYIPLRGCLGIIAPCMAKKNQTPPKNFEDALGELERILSEIEGGQVGLEESLAKYDRGNFLIQHCRGVLDSAQKQIEELNKSPDGGGVEAAE
jgi:exodeoxyribonuclease VII small subunit